MEKRFILAFFLSFLLLVFWNRINPISKTPANFSEITSNKEVISNKNTDNYVDNKEQAQEELKLKEEKVLLENNLIRAEISNINGTINSLKLKKYNETLPITNILKIGNNNQIYLIKHYSPSAITLFYENKDLYIEKKYLMGENDYTINIEIDVQQKGTNENEIQGYSLDINRLDIKSKNSQENSLFEYSINFGDTIFRKENAVTFNKKEEKEEFKNIEWLGFRNKYFCFILKPSNKFNKYRSAFVNEKMINFFIFPEKAEKLNKYSFVLYTGPQDKEELRRYNNNFEKIMSFSNWGILNFAADIMYSLLHFIFKLFPNWGVSIILTAIILYLAMYPLTIKNLVSMKKMQSLQPEIAKIRENNKNNPQKMQKETMELYKENNVNPLGGCLPILIQMPFFIGIYQVLWRSVSFKNAHFLWIKDLSEADHFLRLPFEIPFVGQFINILPIIMIITMFLQQKLSNQNVKFSDPSQETQQKIMLVVFPLMIGFIFYNIASGLSLYFTVFYILSALTQFKLSKMK